MQTAASIAMVVMLSIMKTASGCVCFGSFEERLAYADFAAQVMVTSEEVATSNGNYFQIKKLCVYKTPFYTDVKRAYRTTSLTDPYIRTSCDGSELEPYKVYLIIGSLHDKDNTDTDSVAYMACGYSLDWTTLSADQTASLNSLLLHGNNKCEIDD